MLKEPDGFQGMGYTGKKSLIMEAKGVGVVGPTDWLGQVLRSATALFCLVARQCGLQGPSAFRGLGLKPS